MQNSKIKEDMDHFCKAWKLQEETYEKEDFKDDLVLEKNREKHLMEVAGKFSKNSAEGQSGR